MSAKGLSTDDLPINTEQFPTNWELSVRRATNVIRYFTDRHGIPATRFMAVGYGEYHPMFPNETEESRARDRRGNPSADSSKDYRSGGKNRWVINWSVRMAAPSNQT